MKINKNLVWVLTCEDASHLGGPMGTEYTTLCWTRLFAKQESAKKYAEGFIRKIWKKPAIDWKVNDNHIAWDALSHIFTIKRMIVG